MSKWVEIRNDYVDESNIHNGFVENYIDAWLTCDDNEEGKTIAKITLTIDTDIPIVEITYNDSEAKVDNYAQEMIREGIEVLKQGYIKDYSN